MTYIGKRFFLAALAGMLLPLAAWAGGDHADGHSHNDEPAAAQAKTSSPRSPAIGQRFEGVLVYEATAALWRFYLSDWASNMPVTAAAIALTLNGPSAISANLQAGTSAGVYEAAATGLGFGDYSGIAMIQTPTAQEVLAIPGLTIAPPEDDAHEAEHAHAAWWLYAIAAVVALALGYVLGRRHAHSLTAGIVAVAIAMSGSPLFAGGDHPHDHELAPPPLADDGALVVEKEAQFLLGIRTVVAVERNLPREIRALGSVVARPQGRSEIHAPQSGMLIAATDAGLPVLGQRVQRGQTLALLQVVDRLPLKSPLGGVVSDVAAAAGGFVEAGRKLFEVIDLDILWIEAEIFADRLAEATAARQARIVAEGYADRTLVAKRIGISPLVDAATRTAHAIFEVDNRDGILRPGMAVEAWIDVGQATAVLAVPTAAVLDDDGTALVFVQTAAEAFAARRVALGERFGDARAIRDGLHPGERVVVVGHWQLLALARKAGY